MTESTAYDTMVEEGEIRNSHRNLLQFGRKKFNGEPDEQLKATLFAIRDLDRLERMVDAIWTAASWKELIETR